jgi:indole-3-glycerol phosphate synthase
VILEDIVVCKREHVARLKESGLGPQLAKAASCAPSPRDFLRAVATGPRPAVIAEIKRASPSAGLIRSDLRVVEIAMGYERAGAAAVSVITERAFFQGRLDYLRQVRESVSLPVLCKDFIIDPLQVLTARAAGADAVLLITGILDRALLVSLLATARSLGMTCLVEVHDEDDLVKALSTDARLIGINNRNLRTFVVSLDTTLRLRRLIPADRVVVSESGITDRSDLEALGAAGIQAVLVGTSLMRSGDPGQKLKQLLS